MKIPYGGSMTEEQAIHRDIPVHSVRPDTVAEAVDFLLTTRSHPDWVYNFRVYHIPKRVSPDDSVVTTAIEESVRIELSVYRPIGSEEPPFYNLKWDQWGDPDAVGFTPGSGWTPL